MRRALPLIAASALVLAGCSESEPVAEKVPEKVTETVTEKVTGEVATESSMEPSISESSAKAAPDCTNAALERSPGFEDMEFFDQCEGGFAYPGVPMSDYSVLAQWDGEKWVAVPSDGVWDGMGLQSECYNPGRLEALGVPERFASKVRRCGVYGPGEEPPSAATGYIPYVGLGEATPKYASQPACDGRGILIVDSIVATGSRDDTMRRIAFEALAADPTGKTREYTFPGQCPSLRAQVDGNDIYPVYLDFGTDFNALCAAKAQYGGNARVLSNREEFVDPC